MDQARTGQDRLDQAGSGLDLVRSDITVSRQVDEVRFIKLRSDQIIVGLVQIRMGQIRSG